MNFFFHNTQPEWHPSSCIYILCECTYLCYKYIYMCVCALLYKQWSRIKISLNWDATESFLHLNKCEYAKEAATRLILLAFSLFDYIKNSKLVEMMCKAILFPSFFSICLCATVFERFIRSFLCSTPLFELISQRNTPCTSTSASASTCTFVLNKTIVTVNTNTK